MATREFPRNPMLDTQMVISKASLSSLPKPTRDGYTALCSSYIDCLRDESLVLAEEMARMMKGDLGRLNEVIEDILFEILATDYGTISPDFDDSIEDLAKSNLRLPPSIARSIMLHHNRIRRLHKAVAPTIFMIKGYPEHTTDKEPQDE